MIDLVLRVQSIGPLWLVQLRGARAKVEPLTDADLARIPELPAAARTWDGLLARLKPNREWIPDERTLIALGGLLRERLITGAIAERVADDERDAAARGEPIRYVIHVYEGEEDGLLPRLPFELMHQQSFWFRRKDVVAVRCVPEGREADVVFAPGATALVAWASMPDREPTDEQLRAHADAAAAALTAAGFVARVEHACTPAALRAQLEQGCDLFYLVCHGKEDWDSFGRLVLVGGSVTGSEVGEWIEAGPGGKRVQAALLCACSSAAPSDRTGTMGMAQHLVNGDRGAVAALGFRAPVLVDWALAFMQRVFGYLGARVSLEQAVARARRDEPAGEPHWALPLLFAREQRPGPIAKAVVPMARGDGPTVTSILPARPRAYFVARTDELDALSAWRSGAGDGALAVLAGEGGIGKSELARVFAHRVGGGGGTVLWLERADRDPGAALDTLVRAAEPDFRPDPAMTLDDVHRRMTGLLGSGGGLLVLDDLADGAVIERLRPGPRWRVLVTSRDRALAAGAELIEVGPLDGGDALHLFARLAYDADAVPTDRAQLAAALLDALGHLPLAIELAAAQLRRGETLDEVAAAVDTGRGPVPDAVARVLARSLDALDPIDLRAWMLIAFLPSAGVDDRVLSFALDEPIARAARRLARLRAASVVRVDAGGRHTLHPLARQLARARADAAGLRDRMLTDAGRAVALAMSWCNDSWRSDWDAVRRRWATVRDLVDTIDSSQWNATDGGADDAAIALLEANQFRIFERLHSDRAAFLDEALRLAAQPTTRGRGLVARAELRLHTEELAGAEADVDSALSTLTDPAAHAHRAEALLMQATLRLRGGDLQAAQSACDEALDVFTRDRISIGEANALLFRAKVALARQDYDAANSDLAAAAQLYVGLRDDLGQANVHQSRAEVRLRQGDLVGAEASASLSLPLFERVGNRLGMANAYRSRAQARGQRGDLTNAEHDLDSARALFLAAENELGVARVCELRGDIYVARAWIDQATDAYQRALQGFRRVGSGYGQATALVDLAKLAVIRDNHAGARALVEEAEPLAVKTQNQYALETIAKIRARLA